MNAGQMAGPVQRLVEPLPDSAPRPGPRTLDLHLRWRPPILL